MSVLADVLVLGGGPDAEREVSLDSAREVANALRDAGHRVVEATIGRPADFRISDLGGDVVFPVLHGPWGEGGPLQELLAGDGRPFVGSEALAAAAAMDKLRTKEIAESLGIDTPESRRLRTLGDAMQVGAPAVIKPFDDGSSVGLSICPDDASLEREAAAALQRGGADMVERYIDGRELTQPLLDRGDGLEALAIVEIAAAGGVYDYEAKYERDDTRYTLEPGLPDGVPARIASSALDLAREMGIRDLARVDSMLDNDGRVWLLELNTMPGFTSHSLLPMAAARDGLAMPALCSRLVEVAGARG